MKLTALEEGIYSNSTNDDDIVSPRNFLITLFSIFMFVLITFITILTLLVKRKNLQPLKKKSPKLIILSTIGNMLFCIFLLMTMMFYYGCIIDSSMPICANKLFARFNCLAGFLLLTVCEPLSILPYILRTIRLFVIFKA